MYEKALAASTPKRIAFLGSYSPRLCGIATFTQDLCEAVSDRAPESDCYAGAVNDRAEGYRYPPRVRFELQEKELKSYRTAAEFLNLNNADVLCVQHEFGVYGGKAGSHLVELLREAQMPVVTTLHTILTEPTRVQHRVMDELSLRSDRLVVMADKGVEILRDVYGVAESKIENIPHGIVDLDFVESAAFKPQFGIDTRNVLLTFGLIGPGKGIEHVIEALPAIVKQHPEVVYVILGATHPTLLLNEGEHYRLELKRLASDLGVEKHLIFHNHFVSPEDLREFVGATDIYVTPYLNEAQITSGTLAYVVGAGKAVVSTPYWHAQELLADERGVLVPFRNSAAIADAVCTLLDDTARMQSMRHDAYAVGRGMIWSSVADNYLSVFSQVCAERQNTARAAFANWTLDTRPQALPPRRLDHLARMSDATGIFQHALFTVPNFHEGYCTDDNARAFILCNLLDELGDEPPSVSLNRLSSAYLAFLAAAMDTTTGRFRNFMSHGRLWLEDVGSEDSHGRAVWAAGAGAGRSRNDGHRKLARQLFEASAPAIANFTSPRAWAFGIIGIYEYQRQFSLSNELSALSVVLTDKLLDNWNKESSPDWLWFEGSLTYENARLSQALILSGYWMPHPEALEVGLQSLRWLSTIQTAPDGHFRAIGCNGFYTKGDTCAVFDQQPVEAQAMVAACQKAYRATGNSFWEIEASRAFEWFLGRNDLGVALYDFSTGGCYDGLERDGVNENQGAESTLAFHIALAEMESGQQPVGLQMATPATDAKAL